MAVRKVARVTPTNNLLITIYHWHKIYCLTTHTQCLFIEKKMMIHCCE